MTDKYLTLWNTFIRPSRKSYESKKKTRTSKKPGEHTKKRLTQDEEMKFEETYQKNKSSDGTVDIAILYNDCNNYSHNTVNCHHNNFTNPEFDVEYSFVFLYFILVEIKKMTWGGQFLRYWHINMHH